MNAPAAAAPCKQQWAWRGLRSRACYGWLSPLDMAVWSSVIGAPATLHQQANSHGCLVDGAGHEGALHVLPGNVAPAQAMRQCRGLWSLLDSCARSALCVEVLHRMLPLSRTPGTTVQATPHVCFGVCLGRCCAPAVLGRLCRQQTALCTHGRHGLGCYGFQRQTPAQLPTTCSLHHAAGSVGWPVT